MKCLGTCMILFLATVTTGLMAQNIKKLYVAQSQPEGKLYHVFPLTLFKNQASGDFIFDLTYLQSGDSVTVNFTYTNASAFIADSIRFQSAASNFGGKIEKIYIEASKINHWEHRYSLKCKIYPLFTFFQTGNIPEVTLYSKGKSIEYPVKKETWKKMAPQINLILETIRLESDK